MNKDQQRQVMHNQHRSIIKIIVPEARSDDIVTSANSLEIPSNQAFCFYFSQYKKIFYFHLEMEQTERTLEDFVREIITKNRKDLPMKIESERQGLIFTNFRTKQIITSQSKLMFDQCSKVIVFVQADIPKVKATFSTFLVLWVKIDQNCVIEYEQYKDFQLREVLISKEIDQSQFVGLLVGQQIVRLYQLLSDLQLKPGSHQAYLLLPFQIFYQDMYQTYKLLKQGNFNFQAIVQRFGDSQADNRSIQRRYQTLQSANLTKVTQFTIIYLTSTFFHPKMQKKYINRHFNGKVMIGKDIDLQDEETQQMCMMINSIQGLPTGDNAPIFLVEDVDHQKEVFMVGEIVRIQTFAAATNREKKLGLKEESYYYLYEIDHLTAKNISLYNGQQNGLTHLILPYTDYIVIEIEIDKEGGKMIRVRMREMPLPRNFDTNLIFWISKNGQSPKIYQDREQQGRNEILLIKDNMIFETWLQKYASVTAMRKCCIVWNCVEEEESLEALRLGLLYFGEEVNMVIYNQNPKKFMEKIKERYSVEMSVRVTNKLVNIQKFVTSCFKSKITLENQNCECQKCQLY